MAAVSGSGNETIHTRDPEFSDFNLPIIEIRNGNGNRKMAHAHSPSFSTVAISSEYRDRYFQVSE